MQILKVTDEAFRQYGKVIKDLDVSDIIAAAVTATTFFLQFNKILDKGAGRV